MGGWKTEDILTGAFRALSELPENVEVQMQFMERFAVFLYDRTVRKELFGQRGRTIESILLEQLFFSIPRELHIRQGRPISGLKQTVREPQLPFLVTGARTKTMMEGGM